MLKRGSKNAVFVRGDYKPAKLYKGTQLVAGWSPVTKAAPCAWDGTYNDFLDVAMTGKGTQNGTPAPDTPAPLAASECGLTSKNADSSKSSTIVKSGVPATVQLRGLPGTEIRDMAEYMGDRKWTIKKNVISVVFDGTEAWNVQSWNWEEPRRYFRLFLGTHTVLQDNGVCRCSHLAGESFSRIYSGEANDAIAIDHQGQDMIGVRWSGVTEDGAESKALWTAFLKQQVEAGTPVTLWYGAKEPATETLTLGELKTYPGYTALEVSGDLLPEITAGAKVADAGIEA